MAVRKKEARKQRGAAERHQTSERPGKLSLVANPVVEDSADMPEPQSGMEQGGNRSMRPRGQAGSDQGGNAARGEWRGEGWTMEEHHMSEERGRPGLGNQPGPRLVTNDVSRATPRQPKVRSKRETPDSGTEPEEDQGA